MTGAANAGSIRATVDFDAAGLQSAVDKAMSRAAKTISDQIDTSMDHVESRMASGFKKVGGTILGALGIGSLVDGIGSAIGYINRLGEETEKGLNTFKAVSGATEDQMEAVSEAANRLGNDITLPGTSAADAAQAMTELAKAGFTVDESMAAAKGTLQLATAAQIDAGSAAEISSKQIQAFGLEVADAGSVADILANAANETSADMQGMADSLNQVGAVAHASGFTFTETAAAVALMADNAIVGSDAGTSLKAMLIALQAPSGEAQRRMEKLGIEVYDQQGRMKSLADITAELTEGTAGLTEQQKQNALATIFGSDAIRTVNVLMNQGADGVREMNERLEQQGAAAKLAAANSEGLVGSLGALQSTAESVAIEIYQNVAPAIDHWLRGRLDELPGVLDEIAAYLTQLIDAGTPVAELFYDLAEAASPGVLLAMKAALAAVLGIVQAIGLVLRPVVALIESNEEAFQKLTTTLIAATIAYKVMKSAVATGRVWKTAAIDNYRGSVESLKKSYAGASTAAARLRRTGSNVVGALGGPWGIALAAGAVALGYFAQKHAEAEARVESLAQTLDEQTGAVTDNTRANIANALQKSGAFDDARKLGLSLELVTDAAIGNTAAVRELEEATAGYIKTQDAATVNSYGVKNSGKITSEMADAARDLMEAISGNNDELAEAKVMSSNYAEAMGEARDATVGAGSAVEEMLGHTKGSLGTYQIAAGAQNALAEKTGKTAGKMNEAGKAAAYARREIEGLNSEAISGLSAQVDFESALDDLKDQIKNTGGSLDITTRKGQEFYRKLIAVANASAEVDGGMQKARKAIYNTIRPLTDSDAKARALTNQFFDLKQKAEAVPNEVRVHVDTNVQRARDQIADIISRLNQIPRVVRTDYYVNQVNAVNKRAANGIPGHAGGGAIYGAGTGTSDDVIRRLSNNEHVFTASEVRAAGGHDNIRAIRSALREGGMAAVAELGGGGALVDNLQISVGDRRDLPEAMSATLFHLRRIRRGGRYN